MLTKTLQTRTATEEKKMKLMSSDNARPGSSSDEPIILRGHNPKAPSQKENLVWNDVFEKLQKITDEWESKGQSDIDLWNGELKAIIYQSLEKSTRPNTTGSFDYEDEQTVKILITRGIGVSTKTEFSIESMQTMFLLFETI